MSSPALFNPLYSVSHGTETHVLPEKISWTLHMLYTFDLRFDNDIVKLHWPEWKKLPVKQAK